MQALAEESSWRFLFFVGRGSGGIGIKPAAIFQMSGCANRITSAT
jgi:hypothetical protein